MGAFLLTHLQIPLQLKFAFLRILRQSCPATLLSPSHWDTSEFFDGNQHKLGDTQKPQMVFTCLSALACSVERRLVHSLWITTSSCISLQRLLCGHAEFAMNCSAIANFPQSLTQPNARGFMYNQTTCKIRVDHSVNSVTQNECSQQIKARTERTKQKLALSCGMSVTECETSSSHFVWMYNIFA